MFSLKYNESKAQLWLIVEFETKVWLIVEFKANLWIIVDFEANLWIIVDFEEKLWLIVCSHIHEIMYLYPQTIVSIGNMLLSLFRHGRRVFLYAFYSQQLLILNLIYINFVTRQQI